MNFDQIIALVNAGYTKAEIDAMQTPAADPAPVTAAPAADPAPVDPTPAPVDPTPAQPAAPAQPAVHTDNAAPAQQPAPAQPSEYDRLETLLKQFIGVAQSGNLNAGMSAGSVPQRTSTDILGAVIAPPQKGQK